MRIIEHGPGKNSLVLVFNTQNRADKFYLEFNGRHFEEDASELCYAFFISEVEFTHELRAEEGWVGLPICPICIEKLDVSVTGMTGVVRNVAGYSKRWDYA